MAELVTQLAPVRIRETPDHQKLPGAELHPSTNECPELCARSVPEGRDVPCAIRQWRCQTWATLPVSVTYVPTVAPLHGLPFTGERVVANLVPAGRGSYHST